MKNAYNRRSWWLEETFEWNTQMRRVGGYAVSRRVDFTAERQCGAWLLCPETSAAQEWVEENCELTGLSGCIDADEELLEQLAWEGFVIEGYNDDK